MTERFRLIIGFRADETAVEFDAESAQAAWAARADHLEYMLPEAVEAYAIRVERVFPSPDPQERP